MLGDAAIGYQGCLEEISVVALSFATLATMLLTRDEEKYLLPNSLLIMY